MKRTQASIGAHLIKQLLFRGSTIKPFQGFEIFVIGAHERVGLARTNRAVAEETKETVKWKAI